MKCDVHRPLEMVKRVVLVAFSAIGLAANAHPIEALHFQDQAEAFGLYTREAQPFHKVCKAVNGCDSALPNMFKKRFGINLTPRDHRYLGHNLLGGAIPETSLDYLYEKACKAGFKGSKKEFAAILGRMNAEYREGVVKLAMKTLGLERKEAEALVHILHDIHLLGDLTPENKITQTIPEFAEIVHDIKVRAKNLPFKNPAEYERFIRELDKLLKESIKVSNRNGVQPAVDCFIKGFRNSKVLSGAAGKSWGSTLAAPDRGVELLGQLHKELKLPKSAFIKGGVNTPSTIYSPARIAKMPYVKATKQTVGILKQVTMKNGAKGVALIVPAGAKGAAKFMSTAGGAGITAGVMTFVISEGITTYQFMKGDISEKDFYWESTKNITEAVLVGVAVFVAVTLGATPYGWVVLAVGVTTAIVCDIAFRVLKYYRDVPGFDLDDVLGGVPPEIRNRITIMDYLDNEAFKGILEYQRGESPLLYRGRGGSIFEPPQRESPLDFQPRRRGPLDFND